MDQVYLKDGLFTCYPVQTENGEILGQSFKMLDQESFTYVADGTLQTRADIIASAESVGSGIYDSFEFTVGPSGYVFLTGLYNSGGIDFVNDAIDAGTLASALLTLYAGVGSFLDSSFNGTYSSVDYLQFINDGPVAYYETMEFVRLDSPFLPTSYFSVLTPEGPGDDYGYLGPLSDLVVLGDPLSNPYYSHFYHLEGKSIVLSPMDSIIEKSKLLSGKVYVDSSFSIKELYGYSFKHLMPSG